MMSLHERAATRAASLLLAAAMTSMSMWAADAALASTAGVDRWARTPPVTPALALAGAMPGQGADA